MTHQNSLMTHSVASLGWKRWVILRGFPCFGRQRLWSTCGESFFLGSPARTPRGSSVCTYLFAMGERGQRCGWSQMIE